MVRTYARWYGHMHDGTDRWTAVGTDGHEYVRTMIMENSFALMLADRSMSWLLIKRLAWATLMPEGEDSRGSRSERAGTRVEEEE